MVPKQTIKLISKGPKFLPHIQLLLLLLPPLPLLLLITTGTTTMIMTMSKHLAVYGVIIVAIVIHVI